MFVDVIFVDRYNTKIIIPGWSTQIYASYNPPYYIAVTTIWLIGNIMLTQFKMLPEFKSKLVNL